MNISAELYGPCVLIHCKGDLAEDTLPEFRTVVSHQLQNDEVHDVVLDMAETPFLDSKAMEYLLDLQELLLARHGQVMLVGADENVEKILEITRLDASFERCGSIEQAVKSQRGIG